MIGDVDEAGNAAARVGAFMWHEAPATLAE